MTDVRDRRLENSEIHERRITQQQTHATLKLK